MDSTPLEACSSTGTQHAMPCSCIYAATPLIVADELLGLAAWLIHPPPDRSPRPPPTEAEGPPSWSAAPWVRVALDALTLTIALILSLALI